MSGEVETVVTKCYICDVACVALEKYRGISIARKVVLPMKSLLLKLLRVVVESFDEEIYCPECSKKIEEYDHILQLTEQIETELYTAFRRKCDGPDWMKKSLSTDNAEDSLDQKLFQQQLEADDGQQIIVEYLDDYYTGDDRSEQGDDDRNIDRLTKTTDLEISALLAENEENVAHEESDEKVSSHENNSTEEAATSESSEKSKKQRSKRKQDLKSPSSTVQKQSPVSQTRTTQRRSNRTRTRTPATSTVTVVKSTVKSNDDECEENSDENDTDPDCDKNPSYTTTEDNQFTCEICGKVYKSKSAIKIHLNTHSRTNLHKCPICEKCFTQHGALARHMPMHTGEKPYQVRLASLYNVFLWPIVH